MVNRDELTGMIALNCALAKMSGFEMDKKSMRYSAMADYCMLCPDPFSVIEESISSAIIGDPMNVKGVPVDVKVYDWMGLKNTSN